MAIFIIPDLLAFFVKNLERLEAKEAENGEGDKHSQSGETNFPSFADDNDYGNNSSNETGEKLHAKISDYITDLIGATLNLGHKFARLLAVVIGDGRVK